MLGQPRPRDANARVDLVQMAVESLGFVEHHLGIAEQTRHILHEASVALLEARALVASHFEERSQGDFTFSVQVHDLLGLVVVGFVGPQTGLAGVDALQMLSVSVHVSRPVPGRLRAVETGHVSHRSSRAAGFLHQLFLRLQFKSL